MWGEVQDRSGKKLRRAVPSKGVNDPFGTFAHCTVICTVIGIFVITVSWDRFSPRVENVSVDRS